MFFRKKNIHSEPPIKIACEMVFNSMVIACGYLHYGKCTPTEEELELFETFIKELEISYAAALFISKSLHERCGGKAGQ